MFVNVSPSGDNYQETRCSLAFAQRAKHIVQGDKEARERNRAAIDAMDAALAAVRVRQYNAQEALRAIDERTVSEKRTLRRIREMIEELEIAIEIDGGAS